LPEKEKRKPHALVIASGGAATFSCKERKKEKGPWFPSRSGEKKGKGRSASSILDGKRRRCPGFSNNVSRKRKSSQLYLFSLFIKEKKKG